MGAISSLTDAQATGVVVVANSYERPSMFPEQRAMRNVHTQRADSHKRKHRKNVSKAEQSAQELCRELEVTVFATLLGARSVDEFVERRKKSFSRYVKLTQALGVLVSPDVRNDRETFSHLLDLIEQDRILPWAVGSREEAVFSVETLQRAYLLATEIVMLPFSGDQEADRKLAGQFTLAALWSQLHLDCIVFAILKPMKPLDEVLQNIISSLRVSVMAYAYARQGYEIRQEPTVEEDDKGAWDDEDEQSAQFSSRVGLSWHN